MTEDQLKEIEARAKAAEELGSATGSEWYSYNEALRMMKTEEEDAGRLQIPAE